MNSKFYSLNSFKKSFIIKKKYKNELISLNVIQLIYQIVKDNVLDQIQNRELKDIRNLLIDKENQNIINVTDY